MTAAVWSLTFVQLLPAALCNCVLQVDRVTVDHLIEHFINVAKNDNLGQISTWLLAHADLNPDGPGCEECLELARLHSMAVDFPKTGVPAEIPAEMLKKLVSGCCGTAGLWVKSA